ncbi:hypothetical protein O1611_g7551 [Lasiodiplodia mahajangana]|uniref:Uncharacterized protein n=1 Tax=Lasiodiplodia mahajangana TaxID=1108764 RepID=A0ACC2JFK9_9PEZI|nr:hypothetical protein O1611_g7551 [Lasiodiplodia mahajangana]
MPNADDEPQQAPVDTSVPEHQQHWSAFVPSTPIMIPRPEESRSPSPINEEIRFESGGLAMLDKHMIEPPKDIDAMIKALDAHYDRLKDRMWKWVAKEKEEGRDSIKKVINVITKIRSSKDSSVESDSTDDPLVPAEDVHVGNAIMMGRNPTPEYNKVLSEPHGYKYAHTVAGYAYEEGRKSSAFKEGYVAGLAKIRYEREYQLGFEEALRQYGHSPEPYRPKPQAESSSRPKRATRSPIVQKDGSLLLHAQLVEEVRKLMDTLNVPRADFDEQFEDDKGKGKDKGERRRTSFEVAEFAKDMAYELGQGK